MKKKKTIMISLTIIIAIVLTILISVYIFIRYQLTIKGIILECDENSMLVYDMNRKDYISIGLPQNINLKFKPGQEVRIDLSYDTCIMDSNPPIIDSIFIKKIKIVKKDSSNSSNIIVQEYNTQKQERLLKLRDLEQRFKKK